MNGPSTDQVCSHRWLLRWVCRQELPWLFVAALGHHRSWLLVVALGLLVVARTLRRADRALARAQLRRMRNA